MNFKDVLNELKSRNEAKHKDFRFRLLNFEDLNFFAQVLGDKKWTNDENQLILLDYFSADAKIPKIDAIKTTGQRSTRPKLVNSLSSYCNKKSLTRFDGSPLKIDFLNITPELDQNQSLPIDSILLTYNNNRLADGIDVSPVSSALARELLGEYILQFTEDENEISAHPLWIVCDGNDDLPPTFLLGAECHVTNLNTQSHVTTNIYHVTGLDSANEGKHSRSMAKLLQNLHIDSNHSNFQTSSVFNVLESDANSISRIFGPSSARMGTNETNFNSSLTLSAEWNTTVTDLNEKPPSSSKISMELIPGWGDKMSDINKTFEELMRLKEFCNCLKSEGIDWPAVGQQVISASALTEKIRKLLNHFKTAVSPDNDDVIDSNTSCFFKSWSVFRWKKSYDFCESLWMLLKDVSSYEKLVDSLKHVIRFITEEGFLPRLHDSNRTRLARFIRDTYTGKDYYDVREPILDGSLPLILLIEIGLDKMKRDYSDTFKSLEFAPYDFAAKFFDSSKETNSSLSFHEQLKSLEKLHWCLEALSVTRIHLNLSPISQRHLLNQAFYVVNPCDDDSEYEKLKICMKLLYSDVKDLIDNRCTSSVWRLCVEPETTTTNVDYPTYSKSVIFYLSQNNFSPLPHADKKITPLDFPSDNDDKKSLYGLRVVKSSSTLPRC